VPNKANSKNNIILEMRHVGNYEEFPCIHNNIQCYNKNEDCEKAIVEKIAAKQQKTSHDQESDKNDTTKHEQMTNQDTA
jgi:hypothetical protein